MKIRKHEQGFSHFAIPLIVIVLGVIGYVGWRVYQSSQADESAEQNAAPAAEEAEEEAYKGKVVESVNKVFSLKIPNGWNILLILDSDSIYSAFQGDVSMADALEYVEDTEPVVKEVEGFGTDAPIRFSVVSFDEDEDEGMLEGDEDETAFTTDSGLKGNRYYKKYSASESEEGLGPTPGQKRYVYKFVTAGKKVFISYNILEEDEDRLELIEQVVKTLKIN